MTVKTGKFGWIKQIFARNPLFWTKKCTFFEEKRGGNQQKIWCTICICIWKLPTCIGHPEKVDFPHLSCLTPPWGGVSPKWALWPIRRVWVNSPPKFKIPPQKIKTPKREFGFAARYHKTPRCRARRQWKQKVLGGYNKFHQNPSFWTKNAHFLRRK